MTTPARHSREPVPSLQRALKRQLKLAGKTASAYAASVREADSLCTTLADLAQRTALLTRHQVRADVRECVGTRRLAALPGSPSNSATETALPFLVQFRGVSVRLLEKHERQRRLVVAALKLVGEELERHVNELAHVEKQGRAEHYEQAEFFDVAQACLGGPGMPSVADLLAWQEELLRLHLVDVAQRSDVLARLCEGEEDVDTLMDEWEALGAIDPDIVAAIIRDSQGVAE